jgi:E3 Ubiquitin ligase
MASLPLPVFVVMVLFLLGMAGIAAYAGIHARRRAALVTATPTTPIGMAMDGYREFEGRVEAVPGQPLTASLTHWPCCWYHAKVEKFVVRRSGGESRSDWTTVKEWTSGAPFLVRDRTGVCVVDPYGAEVTPTDKSLWYGATATPTDRNPAKVGPTESAKGMLEVSGGPNSKFRYSEERIYAGDPLLVLGEFSSGRFDEAADDDEDDEDAIEELDEAAGGDEAEDLEGDESERAAERIEDLELEDRLMDAARTVTKATIAKGSGAQPFLFTTTPQADHVAMSSVGGSAALGIAVIPLGLALLLIWLRFF